MSGDGEIKSEAESLKFYHPSLEKKKKTKIKAKRNSTRSVRISVIKNLWIFLKCFLFFFTCTILFVFNFLQRDNKSFIYDSEKL